MNEDEESAFHDIGQALSLLKGPLQARKGRIISMAGDGFIAEFSSIIDAVQAAVEMQQIVGEATNPDGSPRTGFKFRMGLSAGDVIVDETTLHGDVVNIAKRLEESAQPGEIRVSRAVFDQASQRVPFGFEFLGPQRLKNIADPVEVFRLRTQSFGTLRAPAKRLVHGKRSLPDRPSVAVLPFESLDSTRDTELFATAIAEEVIVGLARFRDLFVIARSSSFLFKDHALSLPEMANQLGVRYIVQGTVRFTPDRIRISAQLVEARSGSTIWADRFDEQASDLFAVQESISTLIAGVLVGRVADAEMRRARRLRPEELDAYGLLTQAREHFLTYTRAGSEAAEALCREAVERAPDFAAPWVLLSRLANDRWRYGWCEDPDTALDQALGHVRRAIALDDADSRAYAELGEVYLYQKKLTSSLHAFDRARRLNPNDADILAAMADAVSYEGRPAESIRMIEKAMLLNPFYPDWYLWHLADALYMLKDYEGTIAAVERMQEPTEGRRLLAASLAQLGRGEEARQQVELVLQRHPDFSIRRWAAVQPDAVPEHLEHFVEGLAKAGFPG